MSMEDAVVIEKNSNDTVQSFIYGYDLLKINEEEKQVYTTMNLKNDMILSIDESGLSKNYSYDFFGNPENDHPFIGYSGEVHEGSLQYLRARFYDTETGVFLSRDIYRGESEDLESQNRYAYTQNDPINYIDPSGHFIRNIFRLPLRIPNPINIIRKITRAVKSFVNKTVRTVRKILKPVKNFYNNVKAKVKSVFRPKKRVPAKKLVQSKPKRSTTQQSRKVKVNVEKEAKTLKAKLNQQQALWKKQGLSQETIRYKQIDFIQKYCQTLGLTSVETKAMQAKMGLLKNETNYSIAQNIARQEILALRSQINMNKEFEGKFDVEKEKIIQSVSRRYNLSSEETKTMQENLAHIEVTSRPSTFLKDLENVVVETARLTFHAFSRIVKEGLRILKSLDMHQIMLGVTMIALAAVSGGSIPGGLALIGIGGGSGATVVTISKAIHLLEKAISIGYTVIKYGTLLYIASSGSASPSGDSNEGGGSSSSEGTGNNDFDLNDPDSFEGKNIKDVEKYLDDNLEGYTKDVLKKGDGVRYYDGKGNSYQLNYGYENYTDPLHGNPYLKMTSGSEKLHIPLTK
ncbi:RHS repeat-associated core domain-containing protein [Erysipelothrix urinaevulpis]|uniref:RHS repeat-associated core domain-containing protein n=1 Tax=Erysipelothrix urinaevulpis TaxID=2683717 RepID=UPI00135B5A0F|nr:RHS repeat-associated core domain-containing protein [Erysipelothrix urinaevulpis]